MEHMVGSWPNWRLSDGQDIWERDPLNLTAGRQGHAKSVFAIVR